MLRNDAYQLVRRPGRSAFVRNVKDAVHARLTALPSFRAKHGLNKVDRDTVLGQTAVMFFDLDVTS